jgi:tripartite ATP-independent transporter DctP family solute receptor
MAVSLLVATLLSSGCVRFHISDNTDADKSTAEKKIIIRIANEVAPIHPTNIALIEIFKKEVEANSDGEIEVELYANSQKGPVHQNLEDVKSGELEMCVASDVAVGSIVPEWNVVGLPFLFTSMESAQKSLDGEFGNRLDELLEKEGYINLGWGYSGFREFSNDVRPIRTPADMKDLRFRTMENYYQTGYFTALGSIPLPMTFSELFMALAQDRVDGQENSLAMIWNNSLYELQDYLTISDHAWTSVVTIIGKDFFESLSEKNQKVIKDAMAETVEFQREEILKQNSELLSEFTDIDVDVTILTEEEKEPFRQIAKDSVWKMATAEFGQELLDLATKYNE